MYVLEVSGGLPVPRAAAEQQATGLVITQAGVDVTDAFTRGANIALSLCETHNIRYALLKESSPSCGSNTIYDGSFSHRKIPGQGVTAALLSAHGIKVFSEENIDQLITILTA